MTLRKPQAATFQAALQSGELVLWAERFAELAFHAEAVDKADCEHPAADAVIKAFKALATEDWQAWQLNMQGIVP